MIHMGYAGSLAAHFRAVGCFASTIKELKAMQKPRFHSLAQALDWIEREHTILKERRIWQDMLQADLDNGGGWD